MKPIFIILFLGFFAALYAQEPIEIAEKHKGRFGEAVRLPVHFIRLALKKVDAYSFEEISYGHHNRQYLHICRPTDSVFQHKEIVFFFHGGGWRAGSPQQNRFMAAMLASYGFTVIMPAYRLTPKFCYEDMQADIDSALIQGLIACDANSDQKIIIGGTSAGGHLAALLAYDNERLLRLGIAQEQIKGFFAIASPLDLDMMPNSNLLKKYAGTPEMVTFQMANPKNLIDKRDSFPALFLHGTKDGIVDYRNTLSFAELMELQGLCPEVKLFDELTHLETTSRWYYKEKANIGQGEMLLLWLLALD